MVISDFELLLIYFGVVLDDFDFYLGWGIKELILFFTFFYSLIIAFLKRINLVRIRSPSF